jgi:hypothetical protein
LLTGLTIFTGLFVGETIWMTWDCKVFGEFCLKTTGFLENGDKWDLIGFIWMVYIDWGLLPEKVWFNTLWLDKLEKTLILEGEFPHVLFKSTFLGDIVIIEEQLCFWDY